MDPDQLASLEASCSGSTFFDPDQLEQKPAVLDLHCFQKKSYEISNVHQRTLKTQKMKIIVFFCTQNILVFFNYLTRLGKKLCHYLNLIPVFL